MAWLEMFRRWGSPSTEAEVNIRDYLLRPDQLDTLDRVQWYDKSAADTIRDCEELIANLKEYRVALAKRYGELSVMPYKHQLQIKRHVTRDGHKVYTVEIYKILEDGSKVKELSEEYTGKDRRKAIERFRELRKERPGIEAVMDIEKGKWER